jgi:hypothetical protein
MDNIQQDKSKEAANRPEIVMDLSRRIIKFLG